MATEQVRQRLRPVMAYVVAICVAAPVLTVISWDWPGDLAWSDLVMLIGLTVATRNVRLNLYRRGHFSTHLAVIAAGALLLGPTIGALLGLIAGLAHWPWKSAPHRYLFDSAMFILCGIAIGGLPGLLLGPTLGPQPGLGALIIWSLIVAAWAYCINWAILLGAMVLDERQSPLLLWRERGAWMTPHYLAFGVIAVVMVVAARALPGLGLAVFALPMLMLRVAFQQYLDRTQDNVLALRQANDDLQRANAQLTEQHSTLEHAYSAIRHAFSAMLDARDSETEGHSRRVIGYALAIGRALGLSYDELRDLEIGAQLHDIGKVGVPDAILHKEGPLTADEWAEMRKHPTIGAQMIAQVPELHAALPVVQHHHERWDGKGYPDRLEGEAIPLGARIFMIADTLDAMISDRPYRPGKSVEVAIDEIGREAGRQFDPAVVMAFQRALAQGTFPLPASTADESPILVRDRQEPEPAPLAGAPAASAGAALVQRRRRTDWEAAQRAAVHRGAR